MGAFSHPRALSSSMTSCSAYWTLSFPAPIQDAEECTFLADKGYDVKAIYNLIRDAYHGEAVIPLNKRGTKNPKLLSCGNPICEAGLATSKDGKTSDGHGGLRQKICCPVRQSKTGACPCNHKNWNNGKKNRGCTKYKVIPDDCKRQLTLLTGIVPFLTVAFCSSLLTVRSNYIKNPKKKQRFSFKIALPPNFGSDRAGQIRRFVSAALPGCPAPGSLRRQSTQCGLPHEWWTVGER